MDEVGGEGKGGGLVVTKGGLLAGEPGVWYEPSHLSTNIVA